MKIPEWYVGQEVVIRDGHHRTSRLEAVVTKVARVNVTAQIKGSSRVQVFRIEDGYENTAHTKQYGTMYADRLTTLDILADEEEYSDAYKEARDRVRDLKINDLSTDRLKALSRFLETL